MFDIDPTDEVTLSAADYAQMLEEIKSLRNSLAESVKVHEDMKLGGNKMAESLRFTKASVEDLEAENSRLKAEIDKLTALMGKPKVLEASEVIETGWYFVNRQIQYIWRFPNHEHWDIQSYVLSHRRWVNKLPDAKYIQFTIPEV